MIRLLNFLSSPIPAFAMCVFAPPLAVLVLLVTLVYTHAIDR